MKKVISVSGYVLIALAVLLPLGTVLSSPFGYTFQLTSYPIISLLTAVMSVAVVILGAVTKETVENQAAGVMFALLSPLSLVNAVFYMLKCQSPAVAASLFVSSVCCCYLTVKHGKPLAMKIISVVLSAVLSVPVGLFGSAALIFGDFGQNTVVRSVESPCGTYYAEVIDSDQGALGGDTFVYVYESKCINALVFRISKKPERVFNGDWRAFESMDIHWKDDGCLVIDNSEIFIDLSPAE